MKSEELRNSFLKYFEGKGHKICKSDYLVPPSDPTLLFSTAGMVQFKPLWAGAPLEYAKAASVQKCLRAGGKGSDLENVGKTLRHHTFFEMLGNFSFGDYFKEEAIAWGWEFVTEIVKLDPERIYVTVYKDDDEAADIWREKMGIPSERISRLGDKDNFWGPAGDEGACGPCSELLYDLGPERSCGKPDCKPGCDCERYLEFWNLVFPQYYQKKDGTRDPLQRRGIDTGMGLERLAFLVQKSAANNYETDLFLPIIEEVQRISEAKPVDDTRHYYHVIADHIRALTFAVSENILPSNEGRGYVLRRILRRAFRAGRKIGLKKPFLYRLVPVVSEIMKSRYSELVTSREFTSKVILGEEERFEVTLNNAYHILLQEIDKTKGSVLSGETIFRLYDTYGMPADIIREEAEEKGLSFDEEGFTAQMGEQKAKGKKSWKGTGASVTGLYSELAAEKGSTVFTGYKKGADTSEIVAIVKENELSSSAGKGEKVELILAQTVFYAESGGQIGDTGTIRGENGEARILDTLKDQSGLVIHCAEILSGEISTGESVEIKVDLDRRNEISKHHTATHLLQASLRKVLGEHIKQSGSFVGPRYLRFDFSHFKALSDEELKQVEVSVNAMINEGVDVLDYETDYDKAVQDGVVAIFGEKYGDVVRVIDVGGKSRELCGGVHVTNSAYIGGFKIISESSVSAGVRRVEAVCGKSLYEHYSKTDSVLRSVLAVLKTSEEDVLMRVEKILEKNKTLEKQLTKGMMHSSESEKADELETQINDINVVIRNYADIPLNVLRNISDDLKAKSKTGIFYISSLKDDGKLTMILSCTKDVVKKGFHCGTLLSGLAKKHGGGGGGRPDMAQAGASGRIEKETVAEEIKDFMKS